MVNSTRRRNLRRFLKPRITPEPEAIPGCCWIPLTKGKFALVDQDDFDTLNRFVWTYCNTPSGTGYAVRRGWRDDGKMGMILMHRHILGLRDDDPARGDHENRNKLDNRKINLRLATGKQNRQNVGIRKSNKSGYKGVSWSKVAKKWHATITVDRKRRHLGYFADAVEAARVYDAKAREFHGAFACVNFPEAGTPCA